MMKNKYSKSAVMMMAAAMSVSVLSAGAFARGDDDKAKPAVAPATAPAMKDGEMVKQKGKELTEEQRKKIESLREKHLNKKGDAMDKSSGGASEAAALGAPAPLFTLKDTDGKDVSLADFTKDGKIVALVWFNPDCPFIKKHFERNKTVNDLHAKFKDKGVVVLAVNSSGTNMQGAGLERNKKAKTDFAMEYPVLLDESGEVGKKFGAKSTPHCFIVNKDGVLAYRGAIDNDQSVDTSGTINYVDQALTEILDGKPVSKSDTKAYGCSVKYAASGGK